MRLIRLEYQICNTPVLFAYIYIVDVDEVNLCIFWLTIGQQLIVRTENK